MGRQPTGAEITESAPQLSSLAPEYSFPAHGVYFTILKRTIDTQPEVRNIALAGTYGTGRSSILRQLAKVYDGRVVELSLLTLGVQPEIVVPGGDSNTTEHNAQSDQNLQEPRDYDDNLGAGRHPATARNMPR
ncbi:hypothetical protein ACPW96_22995 [Micromonospora sp. DT81.3]|uniref:YobI family P-loop NTPase n=1 Tax=Micromonospora sp. DT81.3 TaxID=3416523 RepID=UPI003CEBB64C